MEENDRSLPEDLQHALQPLRRQIAYLTVTVLILAMVLAVTAISVFGSLVNYFDGDASLFGSATVGAAFLGFGFGWAARRRIDGGRFSV